MIEDFNLVQRLDLIKEMCSGKRVLHLGCTDYPYTEDAIKNEMLLHFELEKITANLWGIDADQSCPPRRCHSGLTQGKDI